MDCVRPQPSAIGSHCQAQASAAPRGSSECVHRNFRGTVAALRFHQSPSTRVLLGSQRRRSSLNTSTRLSPGTRALLGAGAPSAHSGEEGRNGGTAQHWPLIGCGHPRIGLALAAVGLVLANPFGAEAAELAPHLADVALNARELLLGASAGTWALAAGEAAGQAAAAVDLSQLSEESLKAACAQELGGTDLDTVIAIAAVVEGIALAGAAAGGTIARQRKLEVEKINAQLRQININLRKQARVESYAPSLSYAPVGSPSSLAAAASVASVAETTKVVNTQLERETTAGEGGGKEEVLRILREGKRQLRSGDNTAAGEEFKKALAVAQELGDVVEEKKAARGVGASLQRQGKYQEAIKFHKLVLRRSKQKNEHSGDTEAYGAIADCYTELGDLEHAAEYYDKYIAHLEDED